ncbi:MAG: diaminopimelate epimerase [Candidatus Xiphinematobacter sp.]|nr:MAG: diaminopimelate epimerase [Candidatus Xiphinematobacter sp.]QQY09273.1 MAG: diaminopimelate epimerase [Candidatus Xiphinematobacter sp.]QQY10025.1 MAG: diaminopimelate epimerase [Candidatus Xiphinematobacter sp.]QQY10757.1 MAG: diaminopimelate epimerase [Candidatus Xiphinematobacter sp.]QQY11503.1 MAG: diaminopimelate epimerase [Candidatus Xiphinematobacter sp.]
MRLPFTKMHGSGNDFVLIDNRIHRLSLASPQITKICDRHYGVGADGLLLVEPPQNGGDFRMRYYNSDGQEAAMCGNGARCFARYVQRISKSKQRTFVFETPAGLIRSVLLGQNIEIQMSEPSNCRPPAFLQVSGVIEEIHFLSIGVPHAAVFVEALEEVDVNRRGRGIRFHESFSPLGTNVNFVQVITTNHLRVRTYERGVEAETLACGTGVAASALIHHIRTATPSPIRVTVRGGDTLQVAFKLSSDLPRDVCIRGPASFVFDGEMEIF